LKDFSITILAIVLGSIVGALALKLMGSDMKMLPGIMGGVTGATIVLMLNRSKSAK
jgi:uncharacterized membrane protein YeaQ/YmgE (transglycosylase-associated protein family)